MLSKCISYTSNKNMMIMKLSQTHLIHFSISSLVHACDKKSKGGCEQTCNKNGGGFTCSCLVAYELADDKKSCNKSMYLSFYDLRYYLLFIIYYLLFNL